MYLISLSCMSLLGGAGNWTADGCRLAENTNGIVSCECDHLTNFGVLVVSLKLLLKRLTLVSYHNMLQDICSLQGGCQLSRAEQLTLETISIAGAVLSTIGIIITILTMLGFR